MSQVTRRGLIELGVATLWLPSAAQAVERGSRLHRWFPRFPVADELWVVPFAGDVEEGVVLEAAAGLTARAALNDHGRTLIYERLDNDGYERWFQGYCRDHKPRLLELTIDQVVERLRERGVVRGYTRYQFERSARPLYAPGPVDESVNVATSLTARTGAIPLSERLVERFEKLGLNELADVRERNEEWLLNERGDSFARDVLGTADPKARHARSLMVAMGAFVCSGKGEVYRRALARCVVDSPVIGWGNEAEDAQTIPSTRAALFQTSTNWCHNLTVFAGDRVRIPERRQPRWSDLDWADGIHHAAFVLTDGDNVQWTMGNFTGGVEARYYYGNPKRGRIPFGWGLPVPSLAQLSPRTLAEILERATPNDDFIMFHAGGYFYPDLYGADRDPTAAVTHHAKAARGYMEQTGIRILAFNFQKWDSPAAMAACRAFAANMPGLLGILAFQYYPYSAGGGAIRWVPGVDGDEVPIVSCRNCVWAETGRVRDTTPAGVAAQLNALQRPGPIASENDFSFVMVHAWSRFKQADGSADLHAEERNVSQDADAPGTARGYDPAVWAAERLERHVRPVTPSELLMRVRLRLRPERTLRTWLGRLRVEPLSNHADVRTLLDQAAISLANVGRSSEAARECFEALRKASRT